MESISIDQLKNNPDVFFSQLDNEAENEFQNLLDYFVFKHNLNGLRRQELSSKKQPFELFKNNPVVLEKLHTYTREELHEKQ